MQTYTYTGTLTPSQLANGLASEEDVSVTSTKTIFYPDNLDIEAAIASLEANPPAITTPPDWLGFELAIAASTATIAWLDSLGSVALVNHLSSAVQRKNPDLLRVLLQQAIAIQPLPQETIELANQYSVPLE